MGKADDGSKGATNAVMGAVRLGNVRVVIDEVEPLLEAIGRDAGMSALAQVGMADDASMLQLVNEFAVEYAQDRAAEMVGMAYNDAGNLVDNPNAEWTIDEATRDLLRVDVVEAMREGLSNDDLADRISDSYAFSDERAETVARTETAFADVQGNLNAYAESGQVESKMWITGAECCDECHDLDGVVVALDEDFPDDGGDGPPLHPNCRCDISPILSEDDASPTEEAADDGE